MNDDEFVNRIKSMVGSVKAEAYKAGFTDGISFITQPSTELAAAFNKAKDNALSQVDDLYGRGREYGVALEVVNAIFTDLMNAAHLQQPTKLEDFWDEEEL